jgi:hypothetical protein
VSYRVWEPSTFGALGPSIVESASCSQAVLGTRDLVHGVALLTVLHSPGATFPAAILERISQDIVIRDALVQGRVVRRNRLCEPNPHARARGGGGGGGPPPRSKLQSGS